MFLALTAVLVACGWGSGEGGPALRNGPDTAPAFSLVKRIDVLVDPTGKKTLDDVLATPDAFASIAGNGVNLGYTRDAIWLRIRIAASEQVAALLAIEPNFVDIIDVYVATRHPGHFGSEFTHYALGDHRPLPRDSVSGLQYVVPLTLQSTSPTEVYVRAAAVNSSLNIAVDIYSSTEHTYRVTLSSLLSGVWFGGMVVLLAIQLVFFHFDRKPYYVLLAFSTFGAMLVYVGNLGLSRMLLFPEGGRGNDLFTGGAVWLGLFASSLATTSILGLPERFPWMNRIFLAGAGVGLLGILFVFFDGNLAFAPIGGWVILGLSTLAMVLALLEARENGTGAHLRAAAYTILWFGLVGTIAQRAGLWALPDWVAHSYALTCLLQTLLLTGSLAVRLRAAEALNKAIGEQALQSAMAMVEEKTRELASAKKTAEDALWAELQSQERQIRFMEVISHQYRTPLAVIRSNVDGINLSLAGDDRANRERIQRVRRGIVRLVETLEVNLARSRLQGPSFTPQLVAHSVPELVKVVAARGRDLLQGEIAVEIAPSAVSARILCDAEMVGLAIINLLENASKFSREVERPLVVLSCTVEDGHAVIAVTDNGLGIPAGEIELILGRSVRGSNARSIEGSGIGLSLVARIVAAHAGTIDITSIPRDGTAVRLLLPLLPD